MAVPTTIADLDTTASNNDPTGSNSPSVLDDHIRALGAIVKQNASKGSDIASVSTITIPNTGSYFVVTGTTTITGINDSWNGRAVLLKFSGALTLTNSASLVLFGSNITTAAGDTLLIANESAGVWRAVSFGSQTIAGKTIVASSNTITTAASGNLTSTELNAALAELQTDIDGRSLASHNHSGTYEPVQTAASQAEMEAGTETAIRSMSPLRVAQAIAALETSVTFASSAENAAGTVEDKAVDPLGIREAFNATGSAPVYACRAWVNFNGTGTVAIRASGNVTSITDNGTGDYTVSYTTALPDVNYSVVLMAQRTSAGGACDASVYGGASSNLNTGNFRMTVLNAAALAAEDSPLVCAAVFR